MATVTEAQKAKARELCRRAVYEYAPPEEIAQALADEAERAANKAKRWLRHSPKCAAGKHCEDPFCRHSGSCSCGLSAWLGDS